MSEATKELIWMNQREEPEVSRDWSSHDLDIEELQAHGEVGKRGSINVGGMRRLGGGEGTGCYTMKKDMSHIVSSKSLIKKVNEGPTIMSLFQNLQFDIQEREAHYTMLLTKGDNIIQAGHPAPGPIEVSHNGIQIAVGFGRDCPR